MCNNYATLMGVKRIHVTFPEYVMKELEDRAAKEGRSLSNLVSFLVEHALKLEKIDDEK